MYTIESPEFKEVTSLEDLKKNIFEFSSRADPSHKPNYPDSVKNIKNFRCVREDGQQINAFSGRCIEWSDRLKHFLEKKGIYTISVRSGRDTHSFLKAMTTEGDTIIDPTIGQIIDYSGIFVGSIEELQKIFFDPKREFFFGRKLFPQTPDLSREEWFKILYEA